MVVIGINNVYSKLAMECTRKEILVPGHVDIFHTIQQTYGTADKLGYKMI